MRIVITMVLLLSCAGATAAFDLGSHPGQKPPAGFAPNVPGDRQGGDTVLDAVPVTIPVIGLTGSTAGYTDDYDEVCPFSQSTSPDVVYTVTPQLDVAVDIDLLGSTYDTKVYIYDENLVLVACNDDFYPDFVSKLENVALDGGVQYFVVVDGYGGDFGDYVISITGFVPCTVTCPPWGVDEGEPPLAVDYTDTYNGGCNSDPDNPVFQPVDGYAICGVSGFYTVGGAGHRDTDWFELDMPGYYPIAADAEVASYLFELGPTDCGEVEVLQNVTVGPCQLGELYVDV